MPACLHSITGHQLRSHQYRPGRQAADEFIAFVDKAAQRCPARARLKSGLRQAGVVTHANRNRLPGQAASLIDRQLPLQDVDMSGAPRWRAVPSLR